MASEVQIAKMALAHIGDRYDISDLAEASVEAEQVSLVFDDARDMVLRRHPWGFAKKYSIVSALAGTVPGKWDYMYTYPVDCLLFRHIYNSLGDDQPPIPYEVAVNGTGAKVILTDQVDAELVYTFAVTDPGTFDAEFTMALSYEIAAMIAMPLIGDLDIAKSLRQLSMDVMTMAEVDDSNEAIDEDDREAPYITARA